MIKPEIAIVNKPVNDLIPYINNARVHSDEQINQIAASIKEFGFTNPVLIDGENGIIAGHGRVLASKKLNIDKVPTIELSHLTETQKKAYILADNKLALNAGWDDDLLSLELLNLRELDFDLDLIGFGEDELDQIIQPSVEQHEGKTDPDDVPEVTEKPKTRRGDVWLLGNHRLMCGDSTSMSDVKILVNGNNKISLGFCDPPYNIGYEYSSYDDNKSDQEYIDFTNLWFSNLKSVSKNQIVTLGTKNIKLMSNLDGVIAGVGCWVKKNWVTGCKIAYLQQWEPIFFFGDFKGKKRSTDLFEINRVYQKDVNEDHPCPKQIELIDEILMNYASDDVIDLFGGSGTTLISCERLGKSCYMMELDTHYCDVIVNRWQNFTGKEAILESTGEAYNSIQA